MSSDPHSDSTQDQVSMEESELLKERLQAITDKRRVQEDIAKKRRLIEEEKLQLQYIKKKALREQWLMDGLSPQTGEDQEAQRLQAQEEQEQSALLQSNIHRIEKEIEDLETQELSISANEEVILKRLKEVERTAEDIIKELNAGFHKDDTRSHLPPTPPAQSDPPLTVSASPSTGLLQPQADPKKATFAMEISVEHDPRTGESHVVAMSTITPEALQEKGVKVYEDGWKSVYALHHANQKSETEGLEEMSQSEVEELLCQAMDKEVPTDVEYHQPVYSTSYHRNSRSSTPRTPSKTPRQTPTPTNHSPFPCPNQNGAGMLEGFHVQDHAGSKSPCSPAPSHRAGAQRCGDNGQSLHSTPHQAHASRPPDSPSRPRKQPPDLNAGPADATVPKQVTIKARSEGVPVAIHPVCRSDDRPGPLTRGLLPANCSPAPVDSRASPFYQDSEASLNDVGELAEDVGAEPVTMIFMGFKNAEDATDEEDFQAELVMIGDSDEEEEEEEEEEEDSRGEEDEDESRRLSYHPEGCRSKVFSPRVGVANVSGGAVLHQDVCTNCDDILPVKPTFTHKPGKNSSCLDRQPPLTSTWKR